MGNAGSAGILALAIGATRGAGLRPPQFRHPPAAFAFARGPGCRRGTGTGTGAGALALARTASTSGVAASDLVAIRPGATVRDALRASVAYLSGDGGGGKCRSEEALEPEESAVHLVAHALALPWEDGHRTVRALLLRGSDSDSDSDPSGRRTLDAGEASLLRLCLSRRREFEPVQYIVGRWDFHGLVGIAVRSPVLCPRPETEELVEWVLEEVLEGINVNSEGEGDGPAGAPGRAVRILDVGCGTGAIGIALARALRRSSVRAEVVALDVEEEAVALSDENAARFLGTTPYLAALCSADDFTDDGRGGPARPVEMGFDVVVSNPPYIPASDMEGLSRDVKDHESREALCGGEDGLDVVRDIVRRLPEWTERKTAREDEQTKASRCCWMEVDESHPEMLEKWLAPGSDESRRWGVEFCEGRKDFCGRNRFVKLKVI